MPLIDETSEKEGDQREGRGGTGGKRYVLASPCFFIKSNIYSLLVTFSSFSNA